jgi:alanyl-tRNA synthetase
LLRRASRHAYLLGFREPVLYKLVEQVIEAMGEQYPELLDGKERVQGIIRNEEELFLRTLESGIQRVGNILDNLKTKELSGEVAFDLWQTFGFPLDLTQDMARERGIEVDRKGYEIAREKAKEQSRGEKTGGALFTATKDTLGKIVQQHGETVFLGYTRTDADAAVVAVIQNNEELTEASEGATVQVVLNQTPFYAESGGQIGDSGKLEWPGGYAAISTTQKSKQGLFLHTTKVIRGILKQGANVQARVDPSRVETQKHHSATHLLHAALRSVLGTHVGQAGSLVAPDRLRFDFSHGQAVSGEEIEKIETIVNRWIQADFAVNSKTIPIAEARKAGAMMLFGEKYGENVRMVTMGDDRDNVSIELCGGIHVNRTGEIGSFVVTTEESVSAGVRRIEALTGMAALQYTQALRHNINALAKQLTSKPEEVPTRIDKLQNDLKAAQRESATLRDKLAAAQTSGGSSSEIKEAGGFKYVVSMLEGLDANALRTAADNLLQKANADIVVLASGTMLVTKVSKEAQGKGAHAGNLIKEIATRAGGGGGGKPDMAQAGVKDAGKLKQALDSLAEILSK